MTNTSKKVKEIKFSNEDGIEQMIYLLQNKINELIKAVNQLRKERV